MAAKATKAVANYLDKSNQKGKRCKICTMYRTPNQCTAVQGHINPEGLCKYYEAKP